MDSQGVLGKRMTVIKVTHPHGNLFIKRSMQCAHGIPDAGYETEPSTSSEEKPHVRLAVSMSCLPAPKTCTSSPHSIKKHPWEVGLCV